MDPEPAVVALDEIDLSDPEFWIGDRVRREAAFTTLRDTDPVRFFDEWEFDGPLPRGPGYWALTRHDDIWHVSRNPQLFCSSKGTNIGDLPPELNEFFGSMIAMDDPRHFRLRTIVSRGFTPKEIAKVEQYVKDKARLTVDRLLERFPERTCDFVKEVAAPMPLEVICEMMGIPAADQEQIFAWTNVILGVGDPEYVGSYEDLMNVALAIFAYAQALGEDRAATPRDDLTSILMNAELDGDKLTPQEFGSFFILLVVAGNETTRTAISHGMKALTDHPEQRALWFGDFDTHTRTAVDEIVRWATPVISFRRTATADTEIGGVQIAEGQKLVMWYSSGNRDERVLSRPVPLRRDPPDQPGPDRLRRRRPALLPRRQPRPPGDRGDVRRDPPAVARAADHRRTGVSAELVHQRDQADALQLVSGGSTRR